jgi:hypothetical protein
MLDLKNYRPKEQFFWLRLTRKCCVIRVATGRDESTAIILANAPCLIDSLQDRITPTDVHIYITATQTLNVYIPRRFVHKVTGEEIIIPLPFEAGEETDYSGPAPGDIVIVTGVPNILRVEAVNVPLMLGSHFEITCSIDPMRGVVNVPETADLWLGLSKPDALEDMLPYVRPLLPFLIQV